MIAVSAGRNTLAYPEIQLERRVDTVIIRQGDNEISLDEWYVKPLREALFILAPREIS